VVNDIVVTHGKAARLQNAIEHTAVKDQVPLQRDLDAVMSLLEDYVDELTEIGCDLKDYDQGLIDFTGRHHGRDTGTNRMPAQLGGSRFRSSLKPSEAWRVLPPINESRLEPMFFASFFTGFSPTDH
jgi:hypothetical protein